MYVAPRRSLRLAGLGALALGALLLAPQVAPHGHRALVAGAAVIGLALAAVGAALLVRWPWLLVLGTLACLPRRIPVHLGSTTANLLVPVYGVVVAGVFALLWEELHGPPRARELGPLALPLAAFVLWSGSSLLWTQDLHDGAVELLFFHLPFGFVALAVARLEPDRRWLLALYGQLVLMALAFAAVGVYQYATRDVFWSPEAIAGNAYAPFFRAHSVFYDPSVYGRFLTVAILATVVLAFDALSLRRFAAAAVVVALTWVGLIVSFSESSFVALATGVVVAAALTWGRGAVAAIALAATVVVVAGFVAPRGGRSRAALEHSAGDRFRVVGNGIHIALAHPVAGVGVGAFKHAYAKRLHLVGRLPNRAASHDTPVTVAAETGVVGLALLARLWAVSFAVPLRLRTAESRIVGVSVVAIAVHSLFYNAFFEDPMVWGLFGLAALLARREARA